MSKIGFATSPLSTLPHGCALGRDQVPKWIPRALCAHGVRVGNVGHSLWSVLGPLGAAWPVLPAAALIAAAVVTIGWLIARHRVSDASHGSWVEISCPAEPNPDGAAVLWRLLARRLVSGRFSMHRRVIAWELHAGRDGIRAGLWVPRDVSAAAVAAAVSHAWPGAQTHVGSSGKLPALPQSPLIAVRLRPAAPDWLPVTSVDRLASHRSLRAEADLLRAVFGGLTACRMVGGAVTVQILVRRASKRHEHQSAAAARYLRGLPPKRGILRGAILALLDFVTGEDKRPPQRNPVSPQVTDPLGQAQLHALAAKAAARPHFEVSVRVAAAGGTLARSRELVGEVVAGLDLVSLGAPIPVDFIARRLIFPAERLAGRYASHRHWFLASLPEVAVLANLPVSPAGYGLRVATARRFPPPPEALAA